MKVNSKAILLFLLLALPVCIFLFVKFWGKHHFRVPIYYPLDIQTIGDQTDTVYHTIPSFALVNQAGIAYQADTNALKIYYFFFTRCPGICPQINANMQAVQEVFSNNKDVKIVGISVDGLYDSPEILSKYAERFNVNPHIWQMLTGKPYEIYKLGFYGFKLPADTVDKTLHSEKCVLVDEKNRIRGYYTATEKEEIDRLITEVKILQYERKL